ncbi:MAG TPA: hypothetical protein VFS33_02200 [Gemmatimonadales bacterium]|nr:hypothetical protein [Gemmatimonadales bacterium]
MRTRGFGALLACLALLPAALPAQEPGYPLYCCTDVGRFGPFENGTVNVGEQCSAMDTARVRHVGTACHGPASPALYGPMDTVGYADHCCTDAGVFGPFGDVTWQEGDSCATVAEDGQRHDGVACYSVSGLLERAARNGRVLAAARAGGCGAPTLTVARGDATPASPGSAPRTGLR